MSADTWRDVRDTFGCALVILGWAAAFVAFGVLLRAIDWALG